MTHLQTRNRGRKIIGTALGAAFVLMVSAGCNDATPPPQQQQQQQQDDGGNQQDDQNDDQQDN